MSPERIAPEKFGFKNGRPTISSDCYALGMVIYETISGNFPFHKDTDPAVSLKVIGGERPPRGAKFAESLWGMLERCWAPGPNDRPSIETVLQFLEIIPSLPGPSLPGADEEVEEDDDYSDSTTDSSGTPNWTSGVVTTEEKTSLKEETKPEEHFCLYCGESFPRDRDAERHQRICKFNPNWLREEQCKVCAKVLPVRLNARRVHWGTSECSDAARKRGYPRMDEVYYEFL